MLRALTACAPIAFCNAPEASGQATGAVLSADIPAEPLAQALDAFARQTGLHFVYVSRIVHRQSSHAVSAGLSAPEALVRLLEGTGLRFEFLTAHSVRILTAAAPVPALNGARAAAAQAAEIIITADRREESVQDVPITIQAITSEQLRQLGVTSFDDLQRYTPNTSYSGYGPGTGNIFMRGLGYVGTNGGNQGQETTAPFPNVALYLDDQPMQFPARNNDVYLVDMDRVEVLEGPQGTLFGGGAQAGVIRYITKKPQLDVTSGEFSAGYGVTADGGGPNSLLNGALNLPLIEDTLAVRAVVFSERRGGYIANVPGTIAFPPGSLPAVSGGNPVANNAALVEPDANPVTYEGIRLSMLARLNDEWSFLIQQNYQDMEADGYFYAYPQAPDGAVLQRDEITAFTPAFTRDRYESTAWTLNGSFDDLKAVYAGSFLVRHIEAQQDYSNYLRTRAGTYYACIGTGAPYFNSATFPQLDGKPLQCYAPVADWYDSVKHEHQSHELRLSTNEAMRLRGLLGAYWEKFVLDDDIDYDYLVIPQCSPANLERALAGGPDCLSAVGPLPGSFASDPDLRLNMNNAFGNDDQRGYTQYAFFADVDLDLVPRVLTLSAGTRRYHYDEFEHGSEWYVLTTSPLTVDHANGACTAPGVCGYPINLSKSEGGFSSRANLTWHITPDIMTYYTFSQGFRPGGFNLTDSPQGQAASPRPFAPYCGAASADPRCLPGGSLYGLNTDQYLRPAGYGTDNLINSEIGFKGELLSHRLLLNASAYYMRWSDVQSGLLDLAALSQTAFVVNGPSYAIRGLELQLTARMTTGLTLQGSSAWNSSNQSLAPCLRSSGVTPNTPDNPTPAGECITVISGLPVANPYGALDTAPPFSAPLTFSVRARYDWTGVDFRPFAWFGASHNGSMRNEPTSFPAGDSPGQNPPTLTLLRYSIPEYTIYDAALGLAKDGWTAQIVGSNLSNSYAATNVSSGEFIRSVTPLRPRVLMLTTSYRF